MKDFRTEGLIAGLRVVAVLAWLWLLTALPFLTDVSSGLLAGFFLFFAWWMLAIAWFILLMGSFRSRRARCWSLSAALAGSLGLGLAFTDIGLVARVALCRPWLDTYASQVAPGTEESIHKPRWVGLFLVDGTEEKEGTVLLYRGGFINRNGLVCIPPDKRSPSHVRHIQHLFGPWHRFEWKF